MAAIHQPQPICFFECGCTTATGARPHPVKTTARPIRIHLASVARLLERPTPALRWRWRVLPGRPKKLALESPRGVRWHFQMNLRGCFLSRL